MRIEAVAVVGDGEMDCVADSFEVEGDDGSTAVPGDIAERLLNDTVEAESDIIPWFRDGDLIRQMGIYSVDASEFAAEGAN